MKLHDAGAMADTDIVDPQLLQPVIKTGFVSDIQGAGSLVQDGVPWLVDKQASEGQP